MIQNFSNVGIFFIHTINIIFKKQLVLGFSTLPHQACSRHARKSIGNNVLRPGLVVEDRPVFLKKQPPTKNPLSRELGELVGEVLVVGVNVDLGAVEGITEGLKNLNNGQKLLLNGRVVLLGAVEFARVESHIAIDGSTCDRVDVLLEDPPAELVVTGVRFNVERQVMVGVSKKRVLGNDSFHLLEGLLLGLPPNELLSPDEFCQRSKNMRTTRPHIPVVSNHAKEGTQLTNILGRLHVKDALNLLAQRLDPRRRKPMAKKVRLLHAKLTLQRVNGETLVLEPLTNLVEDFHMRLPIFGKDTNVINVHLKIVGQILEDLFHNLLSNVRRLVNTHRKLVITVKTERSCNGTQFLGRIIQLEGVELHRDVQLGQKLIPGSASKNVTNARNGVRLTTQALVKPSEVQDPSDTWDSFPRKKFLGNDKRSSDPFGTSSRRENTNLHKSIQFVLESTAMHMRHRVSSRITMRCSIRLEIQMYLLIRVRTELVVKQLQIFLQHVSQIILLRLIQVSAGPNDLVNISRLASRDVDSTIIR